MNKTHWWAKSKREHWPLTIFILYLVKHVLFMFISYWGLIYRLDICYYSFLFLFTTYLLLRFYWVRGPGRLKKIKVQILKFWFVGNLDYRKTNPISSPMTTIIFMFVCLNIEDLFEVVLFQSVFQHFSSTPLLGD